jgi:hypothetical protein
MHGPRPGATRNGDAVFRDFAPEVRPGAEVGEEEAERGRK